MNIMNIIAKLPDTDELLTIEVKRVYSGGINDYGLNDKRFTYFQFDCHDRPTQYKLEYREDIWFRGYLIGKKKGDKKEIIECSIRVKY